MNFDPLARWYKWIEYAGFGRAIESRRFAFLNRLTATRRILILGEGDGRCLERLLVAAPIADIDIVDSSARMISITRKRTGDSARAHFYLEDAIQIRDFPCASYDGLVTHFFLDCLTETQAVDVIQRIASVLEPGGRWLVSEFSIPPDDWHRWHESSGSKQCTGSSARPQNSRRNHRLDSTTSCSMPDCAKWRAQPSDSA